MMAKESQKPIPSQFMKQIQILQRTDDVQFELWSGKMSDLSDTWRSLVARHCLIPENPAYHDNDVMITQLSEAPGERMRTVYFMRNEEYPADAQNRRLSHWVNEYSLTGSRSLADLSGMRASDVIPDRTLVVMETVDGAPHYLFFVLQRCSQDAPQAHSGTLVEWQEIDCQQVGDRHDLLHQMAGQWQTGRQYTLMGFQTIENLS